MIDNLELKDDYLFDYNLKVPPVDVYNYDYVQNFLLTPKLFS